MKQHLKKFWDWYERHYLVNVALSSFLFILQLVHLYWLGAHVISLRILNRGFFEVNQFWQYVIIIVDYAEIPALLSTSLLYIYELRKRFTLKNLVFLVFLNSQWIHLFWITDEFVVQQFTNVLILPYWLAWIAIGIDYLEVPVIIDTVHKFLLALRKHRMQAFLHGEFDV